MFPLSVYKSMKLKGEHTARIFTLNHVKDVLEIRMEHF
jgi:hypothetical protein